MGRIIKMKKILCLCTVFIFSLLFIFASNDEMQDIKTLDLSEKPKDMQPGGGVKPDINFGKIPLYFIFNNGQVNEKAKFYAKASRYTLWLTERGLVFDSSRKVEEGEQTTDDR